MSSHSHRDAVLDAPTADELKRLRELVKRYENALRNLKRYADVTLEDPRTFDMET